MMTPEELWLQGQKCFCPCSNAPSLPFSGVVTAVVFIAVCALAVISRLLYQQRQAQRSSGTKEEHQHGTYMDYRSELHLHSSVRDSVKEYYI